ncbi:hypothetical protein ANCDUO_24922 [Ancylostoma duodenale]|uniref:Uncharacterized protein n=1 Tax=Ancylostoma duodenale TaxID=51022 RepID=A0A0C2C5U1_9BILA|nr:hypothetical protein ANCDUO_24922 [Ancylostoma duodenale]
MLDKYWSLESSGTNGFTGPEKAEQRRTNEKVAKRFKETIGRLEEGYYVHPPWKNGGRSLPTNRSDFQDFGTTYARNRTYCQNTKDLCRSTRERDY